MNENEPKVGTKSDENSKSTRDRTAELTPEREASIRQMCSDLSRSKLAVFEFDADFGQYLRFKTATTCRIRLPGKAEPVEAKVIPTESGSLRISKSAFGGMKVLGFYFGNFTFAKFETVSRLFPMTPPLARRGAHYGESW